MKSSIRIRNLRLRATIFFEIPPYELLLAEVNSVTITKESEPQFQDKFHSEYFGTLLSVSLYQYPALIQSYVADTTDSKQLTEPLLQPTYKELGYRA